jgi:hypothetical protein
MENVSSIILYVLLLYLSSFVLKALVIHLFDFLEKEYPYIPKEKFNKAFNYTSAILFILIPFLIVVILGICTEKYEVIMWSCLFIFIVLSSSPIIFLLLFLVGSFFKIDIENLFEEQPIIFSLSKTTRVNIYKYYTGCHYFILCLIISYFYLFSPETPKTKAENSKKRVKQEIYDNHIKERTTTNANAFYYNKSESEYEDYVVEENYVFICTGRNAKVFHRNSYCRGLGNCGSSVISVTEEQARNRNRRPCRICY